VVNLVVDLREPHHTSNLEEYLLQDCCGKLSLSSRVAICGRSVPCAQGLMYEDSNVGCNMFKIIAHHDFCGFGESQKPSKTIKNNSLGGKGLRYD